MTILALICATESSDDGGSSEAEQEPPAKVLSEEELNDLAAKILRAEIMGEDVSVALPVILIYHYVQTPIQMEKKYR